MTEGWWDVLGAHMSWISGESKVKGWIGQGDIGERGPEATGGEEKNHR